VKGLSIQPVEVHGALIAQVTGAPGAIQDANAISQMLAQLAKGQFTRVLAARELIDEGRFDLRTGFVTQLARQLGDYQIRLAVYGNIKLVESLALKAYLQAAGLAGSARFCSSREEALRWLARP